MRAGPRVLCGASVSAARTHIASCAARRSRVCVVWGRDMEVSEEESVSMDSTGTHFQPHIAQKVAVQTEQQVGCVPCER